MAEDALTITSPHGRITYARDALAQIIGYTVAECYGVVGMSARGRVGRLLSRDRLTSGIELSPDGSGLRVDVFVVIEYGLNLAEVAATIRSRVSYELERQTGLAVAAVEVHIQDVRRSA